jgi:hypothetical protein
MADEREKWSEYSETILEFVEGSSGRIDLRSPISAEDRKTLQALELLRPFAVLTAQNPQGENTEDTSDDREAAVREEVNERRQSRLEQELARHRIFFRRVDGVSPDGSYREECVAAVLDEREARELAKRLDQLALFWFDGAAFWLLPAAANENPEQLPRG